MQIKFLPKYNKDIEKFLILRRENNFKNNNMIKMKNNKKVKFLKLQFSAALVLLAVVIASGVFIFTPISWQQVAQALSGNYSKSTGEQLTVGDWNNLPNDFLDKSSDTMGGDLDMGTHGITNLADPNNDNDAATKGYVDEKITNVNGDNLRIVCDEIFINSFNTTQLGDVENSNILVTIDTSSANLGTNPYFVITLDGRETYTVIGTNNIYYLNNNLYIVLTYLGNQLNKRLPLISGDPVLDGSYLTPTKAGQLNWRIKWCGITPL